MQKDDDLYGGYDEGSNPLANVGAFAPMGADQAPPPGTAMYPPGTAMKSYVAPGTASRGPAGGQDMARPMTSVRGAGFTSEPNKKFDPLNQGRGAGSSATLLKKADGSPEEQAKEMEKKVHELLEQSANLMHEADYPGGLEKATEAHKRERMLCKFRETKGLGEQINVDLTYAVEFNLAVSRHANKDYQTAMDNFTAIVKNKAYPQSGRLRVNMGNIFFEQKKYSSAIKMYRMALDQIPATAKEVRFKIMRNIGLAFVRMGQYQDALQSFSTVMDNVPDHQTGYNLVICCYALGNIEGMKQAFVRLIEVPNPEGEEEEEMMLEEDEEAEDHMVVQDDGGLKEELKKRQNYIAKVIVNSAQLISEKIVRSGYEEGFDWCVQQLRDANLTTLANEVTLAKASKLLSNKEFESAINVFKEFEKKSNRVKARAATNLAFLYCLERDLLQADKYSDLALKSDRYNARAYVNKANSLVEKGQLEEARTLYIEAAGIEPYCVEAIFNLGLVNMRMDEFPAALAAFKKLHNMLPDNQEVIYQIAHCYDMLADFKQTVKFFEMLSSLVPNDPGVLARLGAIHARFDDDVRALHYYQESHRVFPVNMDVISWLGAHHVKNEVYEKAIPYFDLASRIQPQEVKWGLMVASCYRRINALPQALTKYKEIHAIHPDDVECLRYLVHLCTELGRREDAQDFITKLRKAEKSAMFEATAATTRIQQQQQQQADSNAADNNRFVDDGPDLAGTVQMAKGKKVVAKDMAGDDEWGNDQLGDDLLPM